MHQAKTKEVSKVVATEEEVEIVTVEEEVIAVVEEKAEATSLATEENN
jgi:hypothetical protein